MGHRISKLLCFKTENDPTKSERVFKGNGTTI